MNKEERKLVAKAFKAAKKRLTQSRNEWDGPARSRYICFAINRAYDHGEISHKASELAKKTVMDRLAPHREFGCWLEKNINNGAAVINRDRERNDCRGIQAHRQAWLDLLIAEFGAAA